MRVTLGRTLVMEDTKPSATLGNFVVLLVVGQEHQRSHKTSTHMCTACKMYWDNCGLELVKEANQ